MDKKNNIKPTDRQKEAFKNIVEDGGNAGKALIKAGYSKKTAKTPTKVTKSRGWEKLMETYLPDRTLAKIHKELLNKKEQTGQLHSDVNKALDMAYKLKGRYKDITLKTDGLTLVLKVEE